MDDDEFNELLKASSLGAPAAKELRRQGKKIIERASEGRTTPIKPCTCNCGCEPDGEWHFEGIGCSCVALECPCVTDAPKSGGKEV